MLDVVRLHGSRQLLITVPYPNPFNGATQSQAISTFRRRILTRGLPPRFNLGLNWNVTAARVENFGETVMRRWLGRHSFAKHQRSRSAAGVGIFERSAPARCTGGYFAV